MKLLRGFLDRIGPYFDKGKKLEKFYPIYEVTDSFFYTSDDVTTGACHVRDNIEFKRTMSTVLVALLPCVVMAMYNTGLQANTALTKLSISQERLLQVAGWRGQILAALGIGHEPGRAWYFDVSSTL